MKNEIKTFLYDIKKSIDSIENYLGDKRDFKVYQNNKMLRRAIERDSNLTDWFILWNPKAYNAVFDPEKWVSRDKTRFVRSI